MTLPYISITAQEGSARPIGSGETKALVIGPSSAGTKTSKIYTFSNVNKVNGDIGYGPASFATQLLLNGAPAGYSNVDVIVSDADKGSIVQAVTGSDGLDITLSEMTGDGPNFSCDVQIEITKAGGYGDGRFRYSLDGGYSWATNLTVTSSFVLPNTNISCSFTSGSYTVGDANKSQVFGPTMTSTHLSNCINSMSQSNTNYTWILVADDNVDPGDNLFDQADTSLTSLQDTYNKFTQMIVPCGGETRVLCDIDNGHTATNYSSVLDEVKAKVSTTGNFIQLVAERARIQLPIPQSGLTAPSLPYAFAVGRQDHFVGNDISKNPAVDPVIPILAVSYDDFLDGSVYHDEKIVCPRTQMGAAGYFQNQALLKTEPNSTWDIVPKARITSRARNLLKSALFRYLNHRVRVLPDGTGRIDPRDKARIEAEVTKVIASVLLNGTNGDGQKGHCTTFEFTINGENNILSTSELEGSLNIVPFAYPTAINVVISLTDSVSVTPSNA